MSTVSNQKISKKVAKRLKKEAERKAFERQLKKDELARELDCVRRAEKELKNRLRALSMAENRPLFKDITMQNWNSFNEAMDRKDWVISEIMEYIDRINLLQRRQFQSYTLCIHRQLEEFEQNVKKIQYCYKLDVDLILAQKEVALQNTKETLTKEEDYIKTVLFSMDLQLKDYFILKGSEFMSKTDEEVNKNKGEKNDLVLTLEQKLQNLWGAYNTCLSDYVKQTEKRAAETVKLRQRDNVNRNLIHNQVLKLHDLYNTIERNSKIVRNRNLGRKMTTHLENLRYERKYLYKRYQDVKRAIKAEDDKFNGRLSHLVITSNRGIGQLEQLYKLGDKIMKMYNLCRKMETKSEHDKNFKVSEPRFQIYSLNSLDKMIGFYEKTGATATVTHRLIFERNQLRSQNRRFLDYLREIAPPTGSSRLSPNPTLRLESYRL